MSNCTKQAKKTGFDRHYESSIKIEQLYQLNRLGLKPIPGLNYKKEIKRYLQEPNIRLRGIAHRIIALESDSKGKDHKVIEENLKKSEKLLQCSGDVIQLAKTQLELAKLRLKENNKEEARHYAQKALIGFSGYDHLFFPDNLRYLLNLNVDNLDWTILERTGKLTERFISMIQDLAPTTDPDEMMTKAVKATNRFFGAERGGIFWFSERYKHKPPILRCALNLTRHEIFSEEFKPNLAIVFKAYHEKQPQVARLNDSRTPWKEQ